MATKRGINKVIESRKTHWQSTPAAAGSHAPTKDTFEDKMPFTNPLSPVLQQDRDSSGEKKDGAKKVTTLTMIRKAIEELGAGKKGSSIPAIKKWIMGNYMGIDSQSLNWRIRKAITKGLETDVLGRSTKSAQMTGAKGYFIVKPKKTIKVKKDPKMMPATKTAGGGSQKGGKKSGHVSDSEVTIIKRDRRKSAKLHVSDTDLSPDSTVLLMKTKPKKTATTVHKVDSKKEKKPEKAKIEKKPEKKTIPKKDIQKSDDEKKVEKQGRKIKADSGVASTSKDTKGVEKPEAKKKEKPVKKMSTKPKKAEADSHKEQTTISKKSAKNK